MSQMKNMMGGPLGGMEDRLSQLDGALESIGSLDSRMSRAEDKLEDMAGRVEMIVDKKVEESLKKLNRVVPAADGFPPLGRDCSQEEAQTTDSCSLSYVSALGSLPRPATNRSEIEYWSCRRALRFRPVQEGELLDGVVDFMKTKLKLDDGFINSMGALQLERIPFGPKTKYRREVLVRFKTVEARDVVRSSASNLAGSGQDTGNT